MRRTLSLPAVVLALAICAPALAGCSATTDGHAGARAGAVVQRPGGAAARADAAATLAQAYRAARLQWAIAGVYPDTAALVAALAASEPQLRFAPAGRAGPREGLIGVRVDAAGQRITLTTRAGDLLVTGSAREAPRPSPWRMRVQPVS